MTRQPSGFELGERGIDQPVLRQIELPAFLGREGIGAVGHQRALFRLDRGDDVEKAAVGIAFEIELEARPPRPHQLGQGEDVGAADMPLVGPRMRRQPIGAGLVRDPAKAQHVRHAGPPRIAQQRDLVEVDAESGHGCELTPATPPRSAVNLYASPGDHRYSEDPGA